MTFNDDFTPKLGKPRARGSKVASGRQYLNGILKAANLARGGAAQTGGKQRSSSFYGSRIGRGSGVGRVLSSRAGIASFRQRRVAVKARIVKLAGKGLSGAVAHLRYVQRDGVTREGLAGELYSGQLDKADGREFLDRADGDRHQFRFIVSAEDGDQFDDLKSVTRRLMTKMEEDLNTKLDWVAVDHYNTGHPHTHIIVRGKDDEGKDLVIAREYMSSGIRERAVEIVSLDLGPRLDSEIDASFKAEVTQDRFTSLDKHLLRNRGEDGLVRAADANSFRQSLLAGRMNKLEDMGLAEQAGAGRWRLAEDLEPTLRHLGERRDIIKTMAHELKRSGMAHALNDAVIHDQDAANRSETETPQPIVGRLIRRGLSDELNDRHYMLVDGADGRIHAVDIGQGDKTPLIGENAIVRIEMKVAAIRETDRTIAEVAAGNGGFYDVDAHLKHDRTATQTFAETHVRRLEAIRKATGATARQPDGRFSIGSDYLKTALDYERQQVRASPVKVEVLSPLSLDQQTGRQAMTWLDRELTSGSPLTVSPAGFGKSVHDALQQRRQWLVNEGLANRREDGSTIYAPGLKETLTGRELRAAAGQLSKELGLHFTDSRQGDAVEGIYRRAVDLSSGKFALIERAKDFTLVPWRSVLENHLGKYVSGIQGEGGINWTIGRGRGIGVE